MDNQLTFKANLILPRNISSSNKEFCSQVQKDFSKVTKKYKNIDYHIIEHPREDHFLNTAITNAGQAVDENTNKYVQDFTSLKQPNLLNILVNMFNKDMGCKKEFEKMNKFFNS